MPGHENHVIIVSVGIGRHKQKHDERAGRGCDTSLDPAQYAMLVVTVELEVEALTPNTAPQHKAQKIKTNNLRPTPRSTPVHVQGKQRRVRMTATYLLDLVVVLVPRRTHHGHLVHKDFIRRRHPFRSDSPQNRRHLDRFCTGVDLLWHTLSDH